MIEFTQDGPFGKKVNELFPSRVRVIGLGQTGAGVCDQLVLHGRSSLDLWVIDSDQQIIDGSIVAQRHLVGRSLTRGLGCNGDLQLGREVAAVEESYLEQLVEDCDFLILIVGLTGGTGVALAEMLSGMMRERERKTIILGMQPYAFEGWQHRQQAEEAITLLREQGDSLMVLALDRFADLPTVLKNARYGFYLMHQQMAKATEALAQILCKRGLIQLSFADIRSVYGRYSGVEVLENSWIAHAEGDYREATENLVEELLQGPMLQDENLWKQVDHALVTVSGTRELGLSDVQEMIVALQEQLPVRIPIATSASLEDSVSSQVRLTLLLAKTAPAPYLMPEDVSAPQMPEKKPIAKTQKLPDVALPEKPWTNDLEPQPGTLAPAHSEAEDWRDELVEDWDEPQAPQQEASWKESVVAKVEAKITAKKEEAADEPVEATSFSEEDFDLPPYADIKPISAISKKEELEDEARAEEFTPNLPAEEPLPAMEIRGVKHPVRQEEIQFEAANRGRFERTVETIYRGENLDQPTFRRRRLVVRL